MDNSDRFPLDIPELQPHKRDVFWLRMIIIGAAAAMFMIHTLGLLYHIQGQVAAMTYAPGNWSRIDHANWCARAERDNPGFECPTPYTDEMMGGVARAPIDY